MSVKAEHEVLVSQQQTYLDFVTAEKPYRPIKPWDKGNARAELAQLRATIAQQAAQLSTARVIIQEAKDDYLYLLQDKQPLNELERAGNCDAWLEANQARKAEVK